MQKFKKILFFIVLALMFLPFLQFEFNFIKIKPLEGAFLLSERPNTKEFTWNAWFTEKFQSYFNKAIEDNIGFRGFLVRMNNQINYWLFMHTDNKNIVIGKEGYLYEEGYILGYTGKNFVGKEFLDKRISRLKDVQQYLKKEKNIDLILVFEPGKASFDSEFIPKRYKKKGVSNYDYCAQRCDELEVKTIDLNKYFLQLKNNSKYPLYPKYSVHWSSFGMALAMDTIIKYIEGARKIDMPELIWNSIRVNDTSKDADFDAESTLNLLFSFPNLKLGYPQLRFGSDAGKHKPMVLAVADSYYWSIYNSKIPLNVFANEKFWYYGKTIYPDIFEPTCNYVTDSIFNNDIEKQEVVLLMITEMNLYNAFWGFTDKLYDKYFPEAQKDSEYECIGNLVADDYWLRSTIDSSNKLNLSIENCLKKRAKQQIKTTQQ
jgi:hypothetical protein